MMKQLASVRISPIVLILLLGLGASRLYGEEKPKEDLLARLPKADRDALRILESAGARVNVRRVKPAGSPNLNDDERYTVEVVIDKKWKGTDKDLNHLREVTNLRGVYVSGPGNVSDKALAAFRALRRDVRVVRRPASMLGILGEPDPAGFRIVRVVVETPADKAGLREGDVLVELAGKPVRDMDTLLSVMMDLEPGTTVDVKYVRELDGGTVTIPVKLGERK